MQTPDLPQQFREGLLAQGIVITEDQLQAVVRYYAELIDENEIQNLTRITEVSEFIASNIIDVLELEKSGFLGQRNLDWGSGAGIPGLLSAIMYPREWILFESEGAKAEFLEAMVDLFQLSDRVAVVAGRLENYPQEMEDAVIVARAVGSLEKLLNTISKCSTWNTLVLLKAKKWPEELEEAKYTLKRMKTKQTAAAEYTAGRAGPYRIIAKLTR